MMLLSDKTKYSGKTKIEFMDGSTPPKDLKEQVKREQMILDGFRKERYLKKGILPKLVLLFAGIAVVLFIDQNPLYLVFLMLAAITQAMLFEKVI